MLTSNGKLEWVCRFQVSARLSQESQESIVQAQQTLCAQMNTIVTNRKSLLTILQVCPWPGVQQLEVSL